MQILLNHSQVLPLSREFQNVGVLFSPEKTRFYDGRIPYALDNGCYGNKFNPEKYLRVLRKAATLTPPLFVVCPDVVCNHNATLKLWGQWEATLRKFNFPIAFVAQDGCDVADVPKDADWVFIGGSDNYKEWAIRNLPHRPIHCGRVNGMSRLWLCHNHKIDSVDGSAWFRDPSKGRIKALYDYLKITNNIIDRPEHSLFDFTPYYR